MRRSVQLLCVLALFACAMAFGQNRKTPVRTLEIGDRAPDFNLPGVDGRNYGLKDFADARILVIIFTCNHCPTAQAYEERIKKIVTDYRDKGVAVVAISPNDPKAVRLDELGYTDLSDSFEEMKIRAKHKGFNFPYLYDGDGKQEASRAYGPTATPHVFIFDEARNLRYVGRIDNSERESGVKTHDACNAIEALLAGKPVSVEKTRAFGCSIKWPEKRASVAEAMRRLAAEEVTLETVDADELKALRKNDSNKLRLFNLWAMWCGPCVGEMPEFVTISRMYRHRGLELITVSADPTEQKDIVLKFLKDTQASNKNLLFNTTDRDKLAEGIGERWNGSLPYTMLVRPGGEVAYSHHDEIHVLELRRAILKNLGPRE